MIANTIDEAMSWFMKNSEGTLLCRKPDGAEKECASFPEAREFFEAGEAEEPHLEVGEINPTTPHTISFHKDGKRVGVMSMGGDTVAFEGDVEDSAKMFARHVGFNLNRDLAEARVLMERAAAALETPGDLSDREMVDLIGDLLEMSGKPRPEDGD